MPDVTWNIELWESGYDWQTSGEEWSASWGGSVPQWFGSIFPRIQGLLPAPAVLEIAPGFGRWTRFLVGSTPRYLGIDLAEQCVAACKIRFRDAAHARFVKNDGRSLAAAADGAFDFVFSFDSLVHVEADVMEAYVPEILRKLTPSGAAFLHHSNMAALPLTATNIHNRARSVSGETVGDMVRRAGGKVLVQEHINWGSDDLTDCFTLFARGDFACHAEDVLIVNDRFMDEAFAIRDTHAPYGSLGLPVIASEGRPSGRVVRAVSFIATRSLRRFRRVFFRASD